MKAFHKIKFVSLSLVLVSVLSLFTSLTVMNSSTSAYTAAEVNSRLYRSGPTGSETSANTAVGWDRSCWNAMHNNRANGQAPRTAINNGGAYQTDSWVSAAGNGGLNTVTVPYGTKTIDLQMNSVTFLCSSMVTPDGAGADYAYSNSRVVSQANYPNDRAPNPVGGNTNWPAYTAGQFRIDSIRATDGGTLTSPSRSVMAVARNNSSRYWFSAPSTFRYTSPNPEGITSEQTITIRAQTRTMNQFSNGTPQCVSPSGAGGTRATPWRFDVCNQSTSTFSLRIVLAPYDHVFGSWVEYGIFAVGAIKSTGSGAAFAGAAGARFGIFCDYSKLSFVNTTTSNPATNCNATSASSAGGYSTGRTIPNVAANFPVVKNQATGNTPVYNDAAVRPQGLYTSNDRVVGGTTISDPITLNTRTISKGQWFIINAPNADVTINGNITYDSADLNTIADIPQLVIIAKNIYINPAVSQVDAWLIAQGTRTGDGVLDTCRISTSYSTALTINDCANRLTVNGPVMAQHLWLRRTAGSGINGVNGDDDPAEIFNLRPDAYMWGFARASTTGRVESVFSNELPPRF